MAGFAQFLRFLGAGGVGGLLYYLVYWTLTDVAGVWYIASAIAASIVNHGTNFVIHKTWTFKNKNFHGVHRQAVAYGCNILALFVLNLAVLYALVEYGSMWHLAAQFIATAIGTVANFFMARWIFAE